MINTVIIKKKQTFRYLLNKGNIYKGKNIVVYYVNSKGKNNMFGVCVSKKNGIAVHRNKMKRWAREIYKIEEPKLKKNITIVIMYKKITTIESINYNIIKEEITKGFEEFELYENNKKNNEHT